MNSPMMTQPKGELKKILIAAISGTLEGGTTLEEKMDPRYFLFPFSADVRRFAAVRFR